MITTVGIILAGGVGSRFKGDKPKQYYQINGKEVIGYSIDAFRMSKLIDDFIVIVDRAEFENGHVEKDYGVKVVLGGNTRNKSLQNAIDYINVNFPNCNKIIENNAACPMIRPDVLDDLILALDQYDFAQCTYHITDALGSYKQRLVNRDDYFLIQSPDAYRFKILCEYFDSNSPIGHPAAQLPESATGFNYFDFVPNIKVTYPEDLRIIEMIMDNKE